MCRAYIEGQQSGLNICDPYGAPCDGSGPCPEGKYELFPGFCINCTNHCCESIEYFESIGGSRDGSQVCWSYDCPCCPYEIPHPWSISFKLPGSGGYGQTYNPAFSLIAGHFDGDLLIENSSNVSQHLHITDAPPGPDDHILNIREVWDIFPENLEFNYYANRWVWYPSPIYNDINIKTEYFKKEENFFNKNSNNSFVRNWLTSTEVIITPGECEDCPQDALFGKIHITSEINQPQGPAPDVLASGPCTICDGDEEVSVYVHPRTFKISEVTTAPWSGEYDSATGQGMSIPEDEKNFLLAMNPSSEEHGLSSFFQAPMDITIKYEDDMGNAFENTQNVLFRYHGDTAFRGDVNNDGACDLIDLQLILHNCIIVWGSGGSPWPGASWENCESYGSQSDITGDGTHNVVDIVRMVDAIIEGRCPTIFGI